jgi:hypothetical protein
MELKLKNLGSSDSRGYDLQKEVIVKVTNQQTRQVRPLWAGVSHRGFHFYLVDTQKLLDMSQG